MYGILIRSVVAHSSERRQPRARWGSSLDRKFLINSSVIGSALSFWAVFFYSIAKGWI